jgi:hypothetical protein
MKKFIFLDNQIFDSIFQKIITFFKELKRDKVLFIIYILFMSLYILIEAFISRSIIKLQLEQS